MWERILNDGMWEDQKKWHFYLKDASKTQCMGNNKTQVCLKGVGLWGWKQVCSHGVLYFFNFYSHF